MRAPYRYDYVGSFLRPEALKEARSKFENGIIDAAALKKVKKLIQKMVYISMEKQQRIKVQRSFLRFPGQIILLLKTSNL